MTLSVTNLSVKHNQASPGSMQPGFLHQSKQQSTASSNAMTSVDARALLLSASLFDECPAPQLHLNAFCQYLAQSMRTPSEKSDCNVLSGVTSAESKQYPDRINHRTAENAGACFGEATERQRSNADAQDNRESPDATALNNRLALYSALNSHEFDPGQAPILTAADYGDVQTLQHFANATRHFVARDREGLTPVMLAARSGILESVKTLFEMGADFTSRTPFLKDTALHIAAESGSPAVLNFLHSAVLLSDPAHLSDKGTPVDVANMLGQTPLHLACSNDRADNVSTLMKLGADPTKSDTKGHQAIHMTAATGAVTALSVLIKAWQKSPLALTKNIESNSLKGENALHIATGQGHVDLAAALLFYGADPNRADNDDETAAFKAARAGYDDVLRLLATYGADLSLAQSGQQGLTPAHAAASEGQTETLRVLAELGAPLDKADSHGRTPVHLAAGASDHRKSGTTLAVLSELGAALNTQDDTGKSPLHVAAQHGNLPGMRVLLSSAMGLSKRCKEGYTPLDWAIKKNKVKAAAQLCHAGAGLNTALPKGMNTAHLAAKVGNRKILTLLHRHNLKLNISSHTGLSPADVARQSGHPLTSYWIQQLTKHSRDHTTRDHTTNASAILPVERLTISAPKRRCHSLDDELSDWLNVLYDERNSMSNKDYLDKCNLSKRLKGYMTPQSPGSHSQHPSLTAAIVGDADALIWLTNKGESLTTRDESGLTPVMLAAQSGITNALHALSDLNANFTTKTSEPDGHVQRSDSALHIAAMDGSTETLHFLRKKGLAIDTKNALGATPLHLACAKDRPENVATLLALGADPLQETKQGARAVHVIADSGAASALDALLTHWRDNNADLKEFLNQSLPDSGETALHLAIEKGHAEVVAMLLRYGADPNRTDNDRETAAFMAAQRGENEMLFHLAQNGADLSLGRATLRQETPAHAAAYEGHTETLRVLAKLNAPMNKVDIGGRNAAHYAACSDAKRAAKTLTVLDAVGVDLNAKDHEGLMPLHLAVALDNLPAIRTLVGFEAEISAKSTDGYTPLDYAALYDSPKAAELLCRLGAQVNIDLPRKSSTAHLAAAAGSTDIIKTLQRHKLSLAHKDIDGLTPADAAERCDRPLTGHWMRQMSRSSSSQ